MRRTYLLSYDISDSKRLRSMHRIAKTFGSPIQYSVFLCHLVKTDRVRLAIAVGELIVGDRDRVVILDLGPSEGTWIPHLEVFGRQTVARPRGSIIV